MKCPKYTKGIYRILKISMMEAAFVTSEKVDPMSTRTKQRN